MADIVERLRADADCWAVATNTFSGPCAAKLEREAADEIERLRKVVIGFVGDPSDFVMQDAMWGKEADTALVNISIQWGKFKAARAALTSPERGMTDGITNG